MLAQHHRRWTIIKPSLGQGILLDGDLLYNGTKGRESISNANVCVCTYSLRMLLSKHVKINKRCFIIGQRRDDGPTIKQRWLAGSYVLVCLVFMIHHRSMYT